MSRFRVDRVARDGEELVALRDTETGAEALIWPALGNNCIEGRLPVLGSASPQGATALHGPPNLAALREHPAFWGIPLLFPFPSRVPGGEYEFEGQRHTMPRDFHGFALDTPWQVLSAEADDARATLRSALTSEERPETLEGYPFPYRVEATYRLDPHGLRLDMRVQNVGAGNMPFGYGAHPYFRLPLGERGSFGECLIRVPANQKWNTPDAPDAPDLHGPLPLVEKQYNGVYTDLDLRDGLVECSVVDPVNGLEAVMRATPNHPFVVVYTHAGAESVCFEPWTCPPNVFNLAAQGLPQHGLVVLAPSEEWVGTMWLSLRMMTG